jgi:hypothetical protein
VVIGGARPYRAVCAWAVCVSAAAARRPRNCRPQPHPMCATAEMILNINTGGDTKNIDCDDQSSSKTSNRTLGSITGARLSRGRCSPSEPPRAASQSPSASSSSSSSSSSG